MTKYSLSLALLALVLSFPGRLLAQEDGDHKALHLWYESPAQQWTEALPVGNGRMGAMIFGGVEEARFQFNEDTLWAGHPQSYANPGAAEYLPKLRQLLFEGKQREAEQLAMRHFMSKPLRQLPYQPFGDLWLEFEGHQAAEGYRRELNLDSAIAKTSYKVGETTFTRETFASYPAGVLVVRITCSEPRALNFTAKLSSPHEASSVETIEGDTLKLAGRVDDKELRGVGTVESKMQLASLLHVLATDGRVTAGEGQLQIENASEATLVLCAATNFKNFRDLSSDPDAKNQATLEALQGKTYQQLRKEHLADHRELFRRVSLDLGKTEGDSLPTDRRILRYQDHADPELEALLFQYGRYLMIASSRPGCQPANLQGLWNDQLNPPWESKYTVNINTEMNYWLTEPCNLAECGEPLFSALEDLAISGSETAEVHYDLPGWVLHHNFDLWRGTAPINASNHGIWPTGGAWLCQHLWWHYEYSGDKEFLEETAYPLLKSAAEFFADYLVDDPHRDNDWLVSGPSNSPEQGGLVMGPTMDHQIIRALFANTIRAAEVLEVDQEFRERLATLHDRIAPNQIGQYGQLQEWLEDKDDPDNRHRHVSHLWGLFPGSEINPNTPKLFAAAKKSLEMRGDGGTGWARAWKINLWARLRDGNHAHQVLKELLRLTDSPLTDYSGGGVYANLFDAHPPFQIDGNFGATNGICQMLLQSYAQTEAGHPVVELLPALPEAWPEGSVQGLRTRGGFTVDLQWKDGSLHEVTISSSKGGACQLRCGDRVLDIELETGEAKSLNSSLQPL